MNLTIISPEVRALSEDFIIEQCAPTLAGIKTGNLFTCPYDTKEEVQSRVREFNRLLVPKGLCLLPMRYSAKRVLLYLYSPSRLKRDLSDERAAELLRAAGYSDDGAERSLVRLIGRLRCSEDFPHEIGLFLSYPPEDVKGFIEHKAADFKYSGLWKVYGDEKKAKELFDKYKKCTDIYCRLSEAGFGIEQLAVAV